MNSLWWNLASVLFFPVCLYVGAVWLVDSAARIAKRLGISELVIGLTVVAFGTSAPEFVVTIRAALTGMPDLSIGNIVGSNIFNLGIILGLVAIISGVETKRTIVYRDGGWLTLAALALLVFLWDLRLERWEGMCLAGALAAYVLWLYRRREPLEEDEPADATALWNYSWKDIPLLFFGLGVVIVSGEFFVRSAADLARMAGISEWAIGATIVGAGTSAPELATSLVAVTRGRHGISAGNLVGSDLFNILGVLGVAAILRPMQVSAGALPGVVILFLSMFVVFGCMKRGWKVTRGEGILLIAIALARWAALFLD